MNLVLTYYVIKVIFLTNITMKLSINLVCFNHTLTREIYQFNIFFNYCHNYDVNNNIIINIYLLNLSNNYSNYFKFLLVYVAFDSRLNNFLIE